MTVWFGNTLAEFMVDARTGLPLKGLILNLYTDAARTTRATGLIDEDGSASDSSQPAAAGRIVGSTVTSKAFGVIVVGAPDGTTKLYYDRGDGVSGLLLPRPDLTYAPIAAVLPRPSTVPTGTVALASTYDPGREVYNLKPRHLRKTRAKLTRAGLRQATCRILCAGDSITAGLHSDNKTQSWPAVLRQVLSTRYPSAGTGRVYPQDSTDGGGWWGTIDAGWSGYSSGNSLVYQCTTNGARLPFVTDANCDQVQIQYRDTNAFKVSIDGQPAVTVPTSSDGALHTFVVSNLPRTQHVVTVTAAGNFVYLLSVEGVDTRGGVTVTNAGLSSSKTQDWLYGTNTSQTENYQSPLAVTVDWGADLVFLGLGMNDLHARNTIPLSTYEANLTTLAQRYLTAGAEVVLVGVTPPDDGDTVVWPYVQAQYRVADALDLPLVDIYDRWGSYALANTLGLMNDVTHPDAAGYRDMGVTISAVLPLATPTVTPDPVLTAAPPAALYTWPATDYTARWFADRVYQIPGTVIDQWTDETGGGADLDPFMVNASGRPTLRAGTAPHQWLEFDGVDDTINALFAGAAPITVVTRFRVRTLPGSGTLQVVGFNIGTNTTALRVATNGTLSISGGTSISSAAGRIAAGTWYTVTAIFNGASSSLVVNTDAAVTGGIGASALGGRLYVAQGTGGGATAPVDVDELAVYARVLSGSEITAIHAAITTQRAT